MPKPVFSSPQPTGAIISQFLISLSKCFEMKENDIIYIETDGDVSLISNATGMGNSQQLEVKEYFDPLTDSHENFWKSLHNWLSEEFDHLKYKELILMTTQDIGVKSLFNSWNSSSKEKKQVLLTNIITDATKRFDKAVLVDRKSTKSDAYKLMEKVMAVDPNKLLPVIDKLFIASGSTRRDELSKEIIERELKLIPAHNQSNALNSLIGFVIRAEKYSEGWEITYNDFTKECQDINEKFKASSTIFPYDITLKEINPEEIEEKKDFLFSRKIFDIEHDDDVIIEAIRDYCFTIKTIMKEFGGRTTKRKSIDNYSSELLDSYKPQYRSASKDCTEKEVLIKSQKLYNSIIGESVPNFDIYNNTPKIYRNGIIHVLANDDRKELIWKLTPKKNE